MYGKYQDIYNRARPYLSTRENDVHAKISYQFALRLLDAEGGDEAVVLPAVILHDVGWKAVPPELQLKAFGPGSYDLELNRIHEVEGAAIAGKILEDADYDPVLACEIVEIILGHDSRKEALSLNDSIVKDADKLWRFSKEASRIDPKRFGVDPQVHTKWLGNQINTWFFTLTARKFAQIEQGLRSASFKTGSPKRGKSC